MVRVLAFQSIWGFHFQSQGIPRITCQHPRFKTMRSIASWTWGKMISVWAFHWMAPLVLVPSTLYAKMGWGWHLRGKLAWVSSPRSVRFPVAPQSMTVVVLMICKPVASLTGKWIVLSFGKATSTCARPLASPSYPRPLFPLMSILQPFSFWYRIEFCESHALDDAEIESWTHITVWPVWPVGHHSMFNHTTIVTHSQ